MPGTWRRGIWTVRESGLLAVLLLGVVWLNYVRVRSDVMHLVQVIAPAYALFPAAVGMWSMMGGRVGRIAARLGVVLTMVLVVPMTVKNVDKYVKNTYKKPFRGQIQRVDFGRRGSTAVPTASIEHVKQIAQATMCLISMTHSNCRPSSSLAG